MLARLGLVLILLLGPPPVKAVDLPFGRDDIKDYIVARLSELAGRELQIEGDIDIDLGWTPKVRVEGVRFANAAWGEAPHLLELAALEVTLDMRELLSRRVVLPRLTLIGPKLFLEVSAEGKPNWDFLGEGKAPPDPDSPIPEREPGKLPQVLTLEVTEGELAFRNGRSADPRWISGRIEQAGGRADGDSTDLAARGVLGGDPYSLVLHAASLDALRAGTEPHPFYLAALTGRSRLVVDGTVVAPFAMTGIDLRASASGPGFDELPLLSGLPEGPPFDLSLHLMRETGPWRVEDLSGRVGESRMTGRLTYATAGERPSLRANLVAETLAVGELLSLVPRGAGEPEAAAPAPGDQGIDLSALDALDAKVDFSARTLRYGTLSLSQVQASVSLQDGHLTLAPLSAAAGGGRVSTRLELDARPLQAEARLAIEKVDLQQALSQPELGPYELGVLDGVLRVTLPPPEDGPRPAGEPVDLAQVLQRVRVEEGHLTYREPGQDTDVRLQLAAGATAPGPSIRAEGRFRGAPVALDLSADPLPTFIEPEPYEIDGFMRIGGTQGRVDAAILSPPGLQRLCVRFDLDGDLAELRRLTGAPIPSLPTLALEGQLERDGTSWTVQDLLARTDRSDLSGRIALDSGRGRPRIDADLHSDTLDLPGLMERLGVVPQAPEAAGGLPQAVNRFDAQLDLDIDRVLLGGPEVTDLDLSARLDQGRLYLGPLQVEYREPDADTRLAVRLKPRDNKGKAADPGAGGLAGTATGRLRGREIDARLRVDDSFGLTEGPEGAWRASLSPLSTRLALAGTLRDLLSPQRIEARLSAEAPDTRGLSDLLGKGLPETPPYALEARVVRDGRRIAFRDIDGRVGESDLEGQVELDLGQQPPTIDAQLRSRRLDYDDLTSVIEREVYGPSGRKPEQRIFTSKPLGIEGIGTGIRGEVQYRAESVVARQVPLDDLALDARIGDRHLGIDTLTFGVAGGEVKLKAQVDARQAPPEVEVSGEVSGVDLKGALAAFEIAERSVGTVAGQIQVWMRGTSPAALAGSADGGLFLLMNGGAFDELLVSLAGLELGEAFLALFDRDRVPIDCAYLNLQSKDGQVDIDTLAVDTEETLFLGDGGIDLDRELLDLTIEPRPKEPSLFSLTSPVTLEGPLTDLRADALSAPLAARALAAVGLAVLQPLAGLIPLVQTGSGDEGRYCGGLMDALKKETLE